MPAIGDASFASIFGRLFLDAFHALTEFIDALFAMNASAEPAFGHHIFGIAFVVFVACSTDKLHIFSHDRFLHQGICNERR
jgi:hypothetical protein